MPNVVLMGNLRQYTGGVSEVEIEAATVRQLYRKLAEKFPELEPHFASLGVAVDGQILQDALFEPLGEAREVHLLPQIAA